jgi:hypothetical protein
MDIVTPWIEPGTNIISDCWVAYRNHDARGYAHQTVNHSIGFVDLRTGTHTNIIESTRRLVKAFLNHTTARLIDYIYSLAHFMFQTRCRAQTVDQFTAFLDIIVDTGWSVVATIQDEPGAT